MAATRSQAGAHLGMYSWTYNLNRDATVLRKSTREDSETAQQGKALGHQLCLPEFWSLRPTWWVRRELTPAKLPL